MIAGFGSLSGARAEVFQSTPSDIAAFVDAYASGPVNQPVFVTSLSEFEKTFGSLNPAYGADNRAYLQIKQFFLNGGTKAWINRIIPPGWVGTERARTGIYSLGMERFDVLILPGIATLKEADARVARKEAIDFVNERNAFLILDTPSGVMNVLGPPDGISVSADPVFKWRDNAPELIQQKNVAIYFPRIRLLTRAFVLLSLRDQWLES